MSHLPTDQIALQLCPLVNGVIHCRCGKPSSHYGTMGAKGAREVRDMPPPTDAEGRVRYWLDDYAATLETIVARGDQRDMALLSMTRARAREVRAYLAAPALSPEPEARPGSNPPPPAGPKPAPPPNPPRSHRWDGAGERCLDCGDKDWMGGPCSGPRTAEPAGWQPIETAPKDGTEIDLWMADEGGKQWREANAYYVCGYSHRRYEYRPDGTHEVVREYRDGWYAPNHGYDGDPGWCDMPRRFNAHPMQNKWMFRLPTHWMPLPAPPSTKPASEPAEQRPMVDPELWCPSCAHPRGACVCDQSPVLQSGAHATVWHAGTQRFYEATINGLSTIDDVEGQPKTKVGG